MGFSIGLGLGIARQPGLSATEVPEPAIVSASINAAGSELTITLSAACLADVNLPILVADGEYDALTYTSGTGTATWKYAIDRPVTTGQLCRLFAERCWKLAADNTPVPSTSTPQVYDTPGGHVYTVPGGATTAWYQAWGGGGVGYVTSPGTTGGAPPQTKAAGGRGGQFSAGAGMFAQGGKISVTVGGSFGISSCFKQGEPTTGTSGGTTGAGFVFVVAGTSAVTGDIIYAGGEGAFNLKGGNGGGGGAGVAGVGGKANGINGGAGGPGYPSGGAGGGGGLFGQSGEIGISPGGGGGGGGLGAGTGAAGDGGYGMVRILTGHQSVTNNSTVP